MEKKEVLRHFTTESFDAALAQNELPVLVDFWASWCGPCRMIGPFVEQIAKEYDGRAIVGKVNVDEEAALAARYGIATIPTILAFKNGKLAEKSVGARPKQALAAMLDKLL